MNSSWYSAFFWALLEMKCRYRRSTIGPFWETVNAAVLTIGIAVIFSVIVPTTNLLENVLYVGLGVIFWASIQSFFNESTMIFVDRSAMIRSVKVDQDFLVLQRLFGVLIIQIHMIPLYILGIIILPVKIGFPMLFFPLGLALLFCVGFYLISIFGLLNARFRDLGMITKNFIQLSFFVTPVFWNPDAIPSDRIFIVEYNIFYHLLTIVREPLRGQQPHINSYIWVLALICILVFLNTLTKKWLSKRLAMFV